MLVLLSGKQITFCRIQARTDGCEAVFHRKSNPVATSETPAKSLAASDAEPAPHQRRRRPGLVAGFFAGRLSHCNTGLRLDARKQKLVSRRA